MINNIKLKFGRADGLEAVSIDATPITVFVGPNNSGKSKILSEIQQFCANGRKNANSLLIDSIELEAISDEVVDERIAKVKLRPNPGEAVQPDHIFVGKKGTRHQVHAGQYPLL